MLSNAEKASAARQAADLIRTYGWFKSAETYVPGQNAPVIRYPKTPEPNKCFCVVTAMPIGTLHEVIDSFARYLGYKGPANKSDLFAIHWNDAQDDPEFVIAALEAFADHVEKELEVV